MKPLNDVGVAPCGRRKPAYGATHEGWGYTWATGNGFFNRVSARFWQTIQTRVIRTRDHGTACYADQANCRWMDMSVPGMTLEWPWNPNHKIKFYAIGVDDQFRWLFRITFANKDQSLYLTLLHDRDFVIRSMSSNPVDDHHHKLGQDFHLSLHESGVVNMTTSSGLARVRYPLDARRPVRHVATLQFNSTENLPLASMEEINSPRGGYLHLPVGGFPQAPVMLSMLCSATEVGWSPPGVGNSMMLHYKTRMKGKPHFFHFVVWQHMAMPRAVGDVGISYGDEGNRRFGL